MTDLERLTDLAGDLNDDEMAVLLRIAERIARQGRESYGELFINTDKRQFRREMLEELLDAVIYGSIQLEQGEREDNEG